MKKCMLYIVLAGLLLGSSAHAKDTLIPKAQKLYQSFQYEKAVRYLTSALDQSSKYTKKVRVKAYLYLSMCHFQRGKPLASLPPMRVVWSLNAKATPPTIASKAYVRWYQKAHKGWQTRQASKHSVPRRVATPPVKRRVVALIKRRTVPRRIVKIKKIPTPKASFIGRHGLSLVLLGVGVATLAAGIGAGAVFQGQNKTYLKVYEDRSSSGMDVSNAHGKAFTTGLTSTILGTGGGAMIGVGVAVFIYELAKKPKKPAFSQQKP